MVNIISLVLLLLFGTFVAEYVHLWELEASKLELLCGFLAAVCACCCVVGLLL
jgi:dipeptide/tripeptide permease